MRAGATRLVVDADSDHDLRVAAVAVDALEAEFTIVTASPGAWLRHHPISARPRKGFALVVLGTDADVNGDLEDLDHEGFRRVLARRPGRRSVAGLTARAALSLRGP